MITITDIITADRVNGGHFFDESTMRGFKSKVYEDAVFEGPGGIYFVTSERFCSVFSDYKEPRKFTIRKYDPATPTYHTTIGEFQQFSTKAAACREAKRLAKG